MKEAVHASCVAIDGRAVLIFGASGAGKSDLALRLIDRGAVLVSDDYTDLTIAKGRLLASPPATIAGKLEMRHVGIVDHPFVTDVPVAVAIDLDRPPERLPEPTTRAFRDIPVPLIGLNALEPSAPLKVEAALAIHGLPFPCRP